MCRRTPFRNLTAPHFCTFLLADRAGLTYLSGIPVLTFDDRDPMELES